MIDSVLYGSAKLMTSLISDHEGLLIDDDDAMSRGHDDS